MIMFLLLAAIILVVLAGASFGMKPGPSRLSVRILFGILLSLTVLMFVMFFMIGSPV